VREKPSLWCLGFRSGTGGGSTLRGDGAREDARLEATIALAKSLPVLRGVIRRGCSMLYCAGMDLSDCDETDMLAGEVKFREGAL